MRLRLNGTEGAQACPPPLVSEGKGPHLGAQQASWAQVGGAIALCFSLLLPEGPSTLPLLISLASLLCPKDPCGLVGIWMGGTGLGPQQTPWAQVGRVIALRSSLTPPRRPLPPAFPDLPSLRGTDPVWPPLLLPPQSPHVLQGHLGAPPISLGVRILHQQPAGTLVVGRG